MDADAEREFVDFVAHRSPALLRVAYALTGDQYVAEDVVQAAFARAYVRWRRIRGEPEPYLKKIIYTETVNRWRRASHRSETTMANVPETAGTDASLDGTDVRLVLRAALLSLPIRQRAVLVLRYLEDLSVEETAQVLGCRPGTVASQASRALVKLRELVPGPSLTQPRGVNR